MILSHECHDYNGNCHMTNIVFGMYLSFCAFWIVIFHLKFYKIYVGRVG